MNQAQLRLAAIDRAMSWAATIGNHCPVCLMGMAAIFTEFLETGDVTDLDHDDTSDLDTRVVN